MHLLFRMSIIKGKPLKKNFGVRFVYFLKYFTNEFGFSIIKQQFKVCFICLLYSNSSLRVRSESINWQELIKWMDDVVVQMQFVFFTYSAFSQEWSIFKEKTCYEHFLFVFVFFVNIFRLRLYWLVWYHCNLFMKV